MTTELDWYGRDWKFLRTQVVKLGLQFKAPLLQAATDSKELPVADFIDNMIKAASSMIPLDERGIWQNSLPLLVDIGWLAAELEKDRLALRGEKTVNDRPVKPEQALARKLSLYLEMNRRNHIADEMGISSNQIKNWERLDKVSREVAAATTSNRCNDEHFTELARFIKTNRSHDKNLPRRAKTVKGYFYRFSRDCIENIDDREETMDKLSIQEAREMLQGVAMSELARCLQRLTSEQMEILDLAFRLGLSKVTHISIESYLGEKNMAPQHFEQQKDKVIDRLRSCLEAGLVFKQGETE